MAEKTTKNHTKTILGICAGVIVLIACVLGIVFATRNNGSSTLGDNYFVSDDSKYVFTLDEGDVTFDEEEYAPSKTHMVYYYADEKVTGLSIFYEYADEESATAAYEYLSALQAGTASEEDEESEAGLEGVKEIKLKGKYVEIVSDESEYADMSTEEVKQNIEFMELLKSMDYEE